MNIKKGLIAVFVMIFFLSGAGLSLLVIDDRKDLSSRASIGITPDNVRKPLENEKLLENSDLWRGKLGNLAVETKFNPVLWFPPKDTDTVFLHRSLPVSIRLLEEAPNFDGIKNILGTDFQKLKLTEKDQKYGWWTVSSYTANFFGSEKLITLWTGSTKVSLLVVSPLNQSLRDVEDFAKDLVIGKTGGDVKGVSTTDDSARLAALVRPSVVMILNNYCASLSFNSQVYPFCLAQTGTGFFIHKDGYIATNGHVVTNQTESSLFYAVESGALDNFLVDFFYALITLQEGFPPDRNLLIKKIAESHKSRESIYQIAALIHDLYKKGLLKIENAANKYYVQLSNTPIQLSKTGVNVGEDIVTASLIASDYAMPDPNVGFVTSDVAIIKIQGTNYPALSLGDISTVKVGTEILVIGYPGVVMGANSILLDNSATAQPTFTRGVISSFKQAKGNKKKLLQTDASINHGNSGGPAVLSDGSVVGIATYGLEPDSGSGNYNFLRDVADLKDLMAKNNVVSDTGETYGLWKTGLDHFWVSYYRYAAEDFDKVFSMYKNHPTVGSYIEESQSKIGKPEDQTPKLTHSSRKLFMNIAGGLMALSVIMIIALSISNYLDIKNKQTPTNLTPRGPLPQTPVQTF